MQDKFKSQSSPNVLVFKFGTIIYLTQFFKISKENKNTILKNGKQTEKIKKIKQQFMLLVQHKLVA